MIYASEFGFSPSSSAEENSIALANALLSDREVYIDGDGIADICNPIYLDDGASLIFSPTLILRRNATKQRHNGYVIVNRGAFTKTKNRDIKVKGLRLICNGVECKSDDVQSDFCVPGLRGHLAFHYIENLTVEDIEILDLPKEDFGIHVCTFENITVKNVHIEGKKDAVHLGKGRGFQIRDGLFRTFDDPIALNAHDYACSNPELGWIEDGVIENCRELDEEQTTGFFCRILAGSWVDWKKGMIIRNSDTVVNAGRLYRAYMRSDGKEYVSTTPPTHEKGTETLDGIVWVMVQEGNEHSAGCRNIVFRNITLEKHRPVAFSLHFDNDNWSHSVYPYSEMPVQSNILFENIKVKAPIKSFISTATPVENITVRNSDLGDGIISLFAISGVEGISYKKSDITIENCKHRQDEDFIRISGREAKIEIK